MGFAATFPLRKKELLTKVHGRVALSTESKGNGVMGAQRYYKCGGVGSNPTCPFSLYRLLFIVTMAAGASLTDH